MAKIAELEKQLSQARRELEALRVSTHGYYDTGERDECLGDPGLRGAVGHQRCAGACHCCRSS